MTDRTDSTFSGIYTMGRIRDKFKDFVTVCDSTLWIDTPKRCATGIKNVQPDGGSQWFKLEYDSKLYGATPEHTHIKEVTEEEILALI